MASISKEKRSGKYRALIRKRGLPTISKTFTLNGIFWNVFNGMLYLFLGRRCRDENI